MKVMLISLLSLLMCLSAYSQANLRGEVLVDTATIHTYPSGAGYNISDLSFSFAVENIGNAAASGIFYVKPVVISLDQADYVRGAKTAALESQGFFVDIAAGENTTLEYQITLPTLAERNYGLFLILNSRSSIQETTQLDNNTKVVDIGTFASFKPRLPMVFDFYTELTNGKVRNVGGRASSGFRTIGKGDLSYFPSSTIDDHNLYARFLLFNPDTMEVETMIYSGSDPFRVEKRWCCLPWRAETDVHGDPIGVDYYSQAPSFEHVNPGQYQYLSVINSRDLIDEDTLANNVDIFPFSIEAIGSSHSKLWYSTSSGATAQVDKTISLTTDYREQLPFSINVIGVEGISVSVTNGTLARKLDLVVSFDPTSFTGDQDQAGHILITVTRSGKHYQLEIPVTVFFNTELENVSISKSLSYTVIQAQTPDAQKITFVNTGNETAKFRLYTKTRNDEWITVPGTSFSINGGQSMEVDVQIDTYAKRPGTYTEKVYISTSSSNTDFEVDLSAQIVRP